MVLVYTWTKKKLNEEIFEIDKIIENRFLEILSRRVSPSEKSSWKSSLLYMNQILSDTEIPDDCWVAIEYNIPQTSKRIDFIITWRDETDKDHVIIVELKQRQEANITNKDWIVTTRFAHWVQETSHPSYQAWSYMKLFQWFNVTVYENNIDLRPCAYLHNYEKDDNVLKNDFYKEYTDEAPVFLKNEHKKLQDFIKKFVKYWDNKQTMFRIDKWEIRPSKALADSLVWMIKGNQEFIMIDEQKVIFENIITLAKESSPQQKKVLIIEWWPGTWKSVVAINALVALTKKWMMTKYVTKNSAPRTVYESKLTWTLRKTEFSNMFSGSWSYINCPPDLFNILLVDEAHRLNEKGWMFKNQWENQIKELIKSSQCTVFFIDEDQRVTLFDIWQIKEIKEWARKLGAEVYDYKLASQFRCNGSDWYLAWLDNSLQIKETANTNLKDVNFDFKVVDSPAELRDMIYEKNKINNKARLVAGYCRNWISKKDKDLYDIVIPNNNFKMRWNLASDGNLWIMKPESVSEVWCIHTCQWLEVDYIGVIIGDDFIVRDWKVITQPEKRARTDASLKWYKKHIERNWIDWKMFVDEIIKNTYRTLMTRWMKGCYVYFTDKETADWFKKISKK